MFLERLIESAFVGSGRDYTGYIRVLRYDTVGSKLLDFGCSWGYGSWQLRNAGFPVDSMEICGLKARFAKEKLGCRIVTPVECAIS